MTDEEELSSIFADENNQKQTALNVLYRVQRRVTDKENELTNLTNEKNATVVELATAKTDLENAKNAQRTFIKSLRSVAGDLAEALKNDANLDVGAYIEDRVAYYATQAEIAAEAIRQADINETNDMLGRFECEAAVERDEDGVKQQICRVVQKSSVVDVQPGLRDCNEGEDEYDAAGNIQCRAVASFTNVFEFKGRKERKIENFSQNQKCKARY
jgi:hypothetical protein